MNYTTIFADGRYLTNTQLAMLVGIDLANSTCRVILESLSRKEIETLTATKVCMIREVYTGRFDNLTNGLLIGVMEFEGAPTITLDVSKTYRWRFSVNAKIIEWG